MGSSETSTSGGLVVVPVDFSAHSEAAVLLASELVGSACVGMLVLHVVHEAGDDAGFYRSRDDSGTLRPIPDITVNLLAEFLERMRLEYPASEPLQRARTLTVSGVPATTIQEVAEREGAAMIVMSSRRRSALARLFRGSVAEQVARRSTCPVMLIKGDHLPDQSLCTLKKLHAVT